jgi:dipeptidyl aminopeptidase/acylaminoacyl peptidase
MHSPSSIDLRDSPLFKEIESFYSALHAPGENVATDAADLAISPDGSIAAFTASVFSDISRAPASRIGIVSIHSGDLQLRSPTSGNDRFPRFSPTGEHLAFLSDRAQAGVYQLFIADAQGGNSEAMPTLEGVVEYISWSNDGSSLLVGIAGFGADIAGAMGGATTAKKAKDLPPWSPSLDTGDAENLWRIAYIFDVAAKSYRRASPRGVNVWECAWLNDQEILAITSPSHSEGSWYQARLVIIDRHGIVRDVYTPTLQLGSPTASPDGRRAAVIEALCSDRLIVCGEVRMINLASGKSEKLNTNDVDVTQVCWRDHSTLTFAGHRGLETVIGDIDLATGEVSETWSSLAYTIGAWYPTIALLPQGGVAAIAEAYSVPPQIVTIHKQNKYRVVRSLATPQSGTEGFNEGQVEPVSWPAKDGTEIQGWLVRPPGKGPFPLVMDIHGGPVWCCRNRWQGRLRGAKVLADRGIASLYPNPRGSSGRGTAFAALVRGDMGGADTHDFLAGIDALVARGLADPARLGVTGISYGGYMSAWLITQDSRFAAAVPISPVTNWYSQHRTSQIPYFDALFLDGEPSSPNGHFFNRSPVMYAGRVKTPTLQMTGALDQNTPPTQALEFHRSLLEHGVRSVLATYPTAGHGIRSFPEVIDATTRYVGWFLNIFFAEKLSLNET